MQISAEIETKVQENTSKSQHYKIASMGDGVDDWLILTAIQKSLIHYTNFQLKHQYILIMRKNYNAIDSLITIRNYALKKRVLKPSFLLARERLELSTSRV